MLTRGLLVAFGAGAIVLAGLVGCWNNKSSSTTSMTMVITVTRSGGFAGRTEILGPVDTKTVPEPIAEQIGETITRMDFFKLPATIRPPAGGQARDIFYYTTTVVGSDGSHSVDSDDMSDQSYQEELDRLIKLLESSGAKFRPN